MNEIKIQSHTEKLGRSDLVVATVDESGKVLSTGKFTFTKSCFCGNPVKTMLAHGVSTPVENRRGGNVRKMFDFMYNTAIDDGVAVSLLHPFSFSYYNKFLYEKVSDHLILRLPTGTLDFVPRRCLFVPYDEAMLSNVLSIYGEFSKGRNLLLSRIDGSHYKNTKVYVYYDGERPSAYISFSTSKNLYINNYRDTLLTVNEMAYTSPSGLREIISFLRMFEGEFDEIEFRDCNLYSELDLLLRHYTHIRYTRLPDISAKILNTEVMLRANVYPEKEGEFTLKITDSLPTVSGIYKVCYGGGESRVNRLSDNAEADILLPSNVFARLIYGNDLLDSKSVQYMEGVEVYGKTEDLFRAFPQRPCGIFEHF